MTPPREGSYRDPDPSDRALVEAVARGEEAAFQELLARYRSLVYAEAYRALSDPEQAEAVLSDTFGAARRTALAFLRTAASVSGWLTHLARIYAGMRAGRRQLKTVPTRVAPVRL